MISRLRMLMNFFREPLFRLLAINLAIGVSIAALMLGGLLALNPHGLRDLIIADRSPLVATGLLLFGLIVTFGSVAMGTAIMMIGQGDGRGGKPKSAPVQVGLGRARRPIHRQRETPAKAKVFFCWSPPGLTRWSILSRRRRGTAPWIAGA